MCLFLGSENTQPSTSPAEFLLIMDNFSAHKTETVKSTLAKVRTEPMFLPFNTTPIMQPLDVLINRSFKSRVSTLYDHWQLTMMELFPEFQTFATSPAPSHQIVAQFVVWAWDSVPIALIKRAFQKAGLVGDFAEERFDDEEEDDDEEDEIEEVVEEVEDKQFDLAQYFDEETCPVPSGIKNILRSIRSREERQMVEEEEERSQKRKRSKKQSFKVKQ